MKKWLQYIPNKIKNKWMLAFIVLFVWLLFFEDVNLISLAKTKYKITQLENEWKYKQDKIKEAKEKKDLILKDVEKYARETYWMKKKDEEIFIFSSESNKNQ